VRVKAFRHTSASQIVRSLSSNGAQIGCGYFHGGAPGLVVGSVLGDVLASVNLALVLRPDVRRLRQAVGWGRMRQLALEYRDFPKFAASQNVINTLSMGLPVLLLTHFYGLAVAGAYAFAWRILGASMGLVLTALRQVLFQKACETQHHGGGLAALYVRITAGLFAMALLPALALIAWGPRIFTWTFGAPWLEAGIFARALVVWLGFAFCNLPAILFAKLIRFQRAVFLADMAMLVARALALLFGGMCLGATATIWLFCVLSAVMNLVLILLVGYAVMKREGDVGLERIRESLGGGQSRPP
jgi:O-antigen/teichoic acid export membrane protein